jgi:RNA polymerase sigma-70 factor (ECF subfamily)
VSRSKRDIFLSALSGELPRALKDGLAALDDLEARLEAACARGSEAWPGLKVDEERLVAWFGERISPDVTADRAIEQLRADDLFIACACASGDDASIRSFREKFHGGIVAALARSGPSALVDEIAQQVMTKLFVGDGVERGPVIAKYGGRGALSSWVQVMAVRDLRSHLRKPIPDQPNHETDALVDRAIEADDAEMQTLKQAYRSQFKKAFQLAFERLTVRQRNLLRHECLDGLNIDQIGAIYGVHRATAARWRTDARTALFDETRRIFTDTLKLSKQDFDSILRLIQSQADVSLPRLLRSDIK